MILLPTVNPSMIAPGVIPLLVFVNVRAGGGQGMQLKQSFRKLLNPHQVRGLSQFVLRERLSSQQNFSS